MIRSHAQIWVYFYFTLILVLTSCNHKGMQAIESSASVDNTVEDLSSLKVSLELPSNDGFEEGASLAILALVKGNKTPQSYLWQKSQLVTGPWEEINQTTSQLHLSNLNLEEHQAYYRVGISTLGKKGQVRFQYSEPVFILVKKINSVIAPSITSQPQSISIDEGQLASLSVEASGSGPLTYQWQLNSNDIANANEPSYTTKVEGNYAVVVSNSAGSVVSHVATVTVNEVTPPPPVSNYQCSYFIDSVNGSNTHSGLSETEAWMTFDKATAYSREIGFAPGDAICFKRGQRFLVVNGALNLGSSGSAADPITYGAYGEVHLPKPVLSPSFYLSDQQDWQLIGNNVYLWPQSHASWNPHAMWEDNKYLKKASSSTLIDGDWFYVKGVGVFMKTSSGHPNDHEVYFSKSWSIFGIHRSSYLEFRDLRFEYAGSAISGGITGIGNVMPAMPIHHVKVENCSFGYMVEAIHFRVKSIEGTTVENHNIDVVNNTIHDIRYAIVFNTEYNGPGRHTGVKIQNNHIYNVSIDGAYAAKNVVDIEAISLQNIDNFLIENNEVHTGLKLAKGLTNSTGRPYFSAGLVIWRHPEAMITNVRIQNNRFHDLSVGAIVGASPADANRSITIANNIISKNEMGLKLNGMDSTNTFSVFYNTFYRNGTSMTVAPINGPQIMGNLSVEPINFHVVSYGNGGYAESKKNAYVPNGPLFQTYNSSNPSLSATYTNLEDWQESTSYEDLSITANDAHFVVSDPKLAEDFQLSPSSPFIDATDDVSSVVPYDFSGRQRAIGPLVDMGALQ